MLQLLLVLQATPAHNLGHWPEDYEQQCGLGKILYFYIINLILRREKGRQNLLKFNFLSSLPIVFGAELSGLPPLRLGKDN